METREEGALVWEPPEALRERATMTRYMRWLEAERGLAFEDYGALWRWSTDDLEAFWGSIWDFFGVQGRYERVLADASMPGAVWFPGTEVNYAEHALRDKSPERTAILHASELRELDEWTWEELREQVQRIAAGLRERGVQRGDRVVAYMPNMPETAAAFLAVASLGAVWSSCSPDFGARSVVDRFAQVEPKVLLAVDGYRYNGRDFDRGDVIARLQDEMPSLEHTVVLPYLGSEGDWDEAFGPSDEPLAFERVPFDHPLWILYSSGTTGLPKAIVQSQGGILLEHLKMLNLHLDAQDGDRLFWFTTTGWMMWNFLVSGLLTDAAVVLYDGSPGHPDMDVLWDLAERTGMTCFGTSASYIANCMKAEVEPAAGRDLGALRSVGSTGSPLAPEGFDWIYEQLGEDTWLFSTSGGTDLCSAFVGGVPLLPVHRGELQAPALGARVEAY
ncbi:MAG: acetoacetate--CoA ligase, partial [Actinomycetota bacterium]|nr:acetoacetate--CoA ligase [Actinomycetota bacterium]